MKVSDEHKPAISFIGFSASIRPEEGYQKCPEFWDREYTRKYARLWQTMKPESDWAMFSANGPLPGSLQELNTKVWQEWYPNEGQKYMPVSYTGTAYTLENRRPDAEALVKGLSWMEYSPEGTEERCCYPVRKA